ncbi:hypothetical protein E4H12_11110 [Candidatus Thorarchaeota archaeon]|nr:MAG: hypothetical protein E4H12_11110 [Candidatus Thorarchaeota archaeon]
MAEEPRYWGSWKGRVVKAIAINRAQTWLDIKEVTGLSKTALNRVLKELYDVDAIYQNPKGTYWVETDLYAQYASPNLLVVVVVANGHNMRARIT